ncbi:unnamed protein product, partial [Pylaiella littoralis]
AWPAGRGCQVYTKRGPPLDNVVHPVRLVFFCFPRWYGYVRSYPFRFAACKRLLLPFHEYGRKTRLVAACSKHYHFMVTEDTWEAACNRRAFRADGGHKSDRSCSTVQKHRDGVVKASTVIVRSCLFS